MKTPEEMIGELYTVILGVPGTEEGGMAERSKKMAERCESIEEHLARQNGKIQTNTTWRKAFCWALGLMVPILGIIAGFLLTGGLS